MTETVEVRKALLERLLDRVDDLEAELREYRAENERDKAHIRREVTEAVEESERSEPGEDRKENEGMLPIERLAKFGEDSTVIADVTASVKRARAIFQHFKQWSSKTPSGYVVKGNLKSLLETATGESLYWKQVHRACKKLEQWSKGVFEFKKTRKHGWIVVVESLERMSSARTS